MGSRSLGRPAEHLHETNRSRALFATHYHELVALTAQLDACKPYTMRVKEWQGDVVFLHEVAAGAADRSYGIHVARLAGLPSPAVVRAEQVLETLEQESNPGRLRAWRKTYRFLPPWPKRPRTTPLSRRASKPSFGI